MSDGRKKTTTENAGPDYEVGFGKPPKKTQFKPGQSGNPRGRPKGTKNLKTDLIEELNEKIAVREGNHSQTVSKQRAVVKTLMARTLQGDVRSANLIISRMMRLAETGEGSPDVEDGLIEHELAILKDFEDRTRRRDDDPPVENGGDRDEEPEDPS